MKQILEGVTTKELLVQYKSIIRDCLPPNLKDALKYINFNPRHYEDEIALKERELVILNATPLAELVEKEILSYTEWIAILEKNFTHEQRILQERANNIIAELKKWEPVAECSKHLKEKLVELIIDNVEYDLYAWAKHREEFTPEVAERQIVARKESLEQAIISLREKLPIAVEIDCAIAKLEKQLQKDLELIP